RGQELWLEDKQNSKAAVRLTREGIPFGLLPNLSGVLYRVAGGLYFAPITAVDKGRVTQGKPTANP
ncbi:MAG: hypothetical protein V4671_01005, partial [Armatimonadota bacterium]